jgi:hypothetical protein
MQGFQFEFFFFMKRNWLVLHISDQLTQSYGTVCYLVILLQMRVCIQSRSRIHERTISLRCEVIILRVLSGS